MSPHGFFIDFRAPARSHGQEMPMFKAGLTVTRSSYQGTQSGSSCSHGGARARNGRIMVARWP